MDNDVACGIFHIPYDCGFWNISVAAYGMEHAKCVIGTIIIGNMHQRLIKIAFPFLQYKMSDFMHVEWCSHDKKRSGKKHWALIADMSFKVG